ncbi:MAG: type II toxin-antitoxin system prevent-host-death family antitoxin [bacterium]|nr:type II toxin-antitoxin system prevent-host-death family antitoxin [bacterium]
MVKTLSIQEAQNKLPGIVKKLRSGDFVVVEKQGKPIAGIVDFEDMEDFLELNNESLQKQIRKGYKEFKVGKAIPARTFLKTL